MSQVVRWVRRVRWGPRCCFLLFFLVGRAVLGLQMALSENWSSTIRGICQIRWVPLHGTFCVDCAGLCKMSKADKNRLTGSRLGLGESASGLGSPPPFDTHLSCLSSAPCLRPWGHRRPTSGPVASRSWLFPRPATPACLVLRQGQRAANFLGHRCSDESEKAEKAEKAGTCLGNAGYRVSSGVFLGRSSGDGDGSGDGPMSQVLLWNIFCSKERGRRNGLMVNRESHVTRDHTVALAGEARWYLYHYLLMTIPRR